VVTTPAGQDRDTSGQDRDASGRDRDTGGRARNARPRDSLGRPLPRSAADDGPRIPDDLVITAAEAASLGGRLLAEGQPFQAHEVFEAAWKSLPSPDRDLWRGLAQVAVGLTHARRGNAAGAVALLRRGSANVAAAGASPEVDTAQVAASATRIALRIETGGLAAVSPAELRLRLGPDSSSPQD
jgi:hypothetical protein